MNQTIIIVGGGQAAAMTAAALRQQGFDGTLKVLSEETYLPYERPPLSKAMLCDEDPRLTPVLPENWWQDNHVSIQLAQKVVGLDTDRKKLQLADGSEEHFDRLVLATGACARRLPLLDKLGTCSHTLRSAADAERLREELKPGRRVLLVGAGTIGLELAASARHRGCDVTVLEAGPTVMGRNAPHPVREWLINRHAEAGVNILLNACIEAASVRENQVTLTLQDGRELQGDLVIYGIGITACDELAREAGLETDNGIIVNPQGQTSHPAIFAAGDVTRVRRADGLPERLETWENANRQAEIVATTLLDQPQPEAVPGWFWTDQYEANIQFIGSMAHENWLVRGTPDGGKAIWLALQNGKLTGAVTLNQGREIRVLRQLISSGKTLSAEQLTDESVVLKKLLNG